jgi:hypothetical protein
MLSTKAKVVTVNILNNINDDIKETESKLLSITEKLVIDAQEESISTNIINSVF